MNDRLEKRIVQYLRSSRSFIGRVEPAAWLQRRFHSRASCVFSVRSLHLRSASHRIRRGRRTADEDLGTEKIRYETNVSPLVYPLNCRLTCSVGGHLTSTTLSLEVSPLETRRWIPSFENAKKKPLSQHPTSFQTSSRPPSSCTPLEPRTAGSLPKSNTSTTFPSPALPISFLVRTPRMEKWSHSSC